jgi:DNA gyrase/topoisomerase IV subunit B
MIVDGYEAIRMRLMMFIGDIERGVHCLVVELVDNSIAEARVGFGRLILVVPSFRCNDIRGRR